MKANKLTIILITIFLLTWNLYSEILSSSQSEYIIKDAAYIEWGPEVEDCRFSMITDRKTYHSDQPVRMCLIFENERDDSVPVTLPYFSSCRLVVRTPDGNQASRTVYGKRPAESLGLGGAIVINPRDAEIKYIPALNRLFDMSKEGEYTITAYREISDYENNKLIEIPSNTIKIRILDEAKESDASKVFDDIIEKRPEPKDIQKKSPKKKGRSQPKKTDDGVDII